MQTLTEGDSSMKSSSFVNIVTKTDVEHAFNAKQKIQLIKLYREKFNTRPKDSKDAIETILPYPDPSDPFDPNGYEKKFNKENLQKMFKLFFPGEINEGENNLFFAITKMKENWKHLGYKSFKDGILSIMQNF
jgi:hypothetical protein